MGDTHPSIVEVVAMTVESPVALGIMNTTQALDLPEDLVIKIACANITPAAPESLIDRVDLRRGLTKP